VNEELSAVQKKNELAVAEADESEAQSIRALGLYNILDQLLNGVYLKIYSCIIFLEGVATSMNF
jgi:hypothetical protein